MRREPLGAHRPLAVAVGVGTALVLFAACGGGGSSNTGEQVPVEEQLGLEQDGILVRQGKAENVIHDCMKAQGFDYIPVDPQAQRAALVGQAGMSEEDFNKQFGYGITTLYGKEQTVDAANPNIPIRNGLSDADRRPTTTRSTATTRVQRSARRSTPATSAGWEAAPRRRRTRSSAARP